MAPHLMTAQGAYKANKHATHTNAHTHTNTPHPSIVVVFCFCFFSCNGPCAPKEKWHRKEHIIIIIIINKSCNVLRRVKDLAKA